MLLRASVVRSLLLCALFMSALGEEICGTTDGFAILQTIRNRTNSSLDSDMYTPTQKHYENCPDDTLRCMSSEMEMLLDEWSMDDTRNKDINRLLGIVDIILSMINQTKIKASGCVRCEQFPERPAVTFLDALEDTLQQINTDCQSRRG